MQVQVYSFEGKLSSSFKLNASQASSLKGDMSLSPEFLSYVDPAALDTIQMVDIASGKAISSSKWTHHCEIKQILAYGKKSLRFGSMDVMAFIDQQSDLWLLDVAKQSCRKLASMVDSACWNDKYPSLASVSEGEVTVWYYPAALFLDTELLSTAAFVTDKM